MSPYADKEIHGDKHYFPERIEKEEVERRKHACNAGKYPEKVEVIETYALCDAFPGNQYRHNAEEKGKQN
jgi:hypothetical protein